MKDKSTFDNEYYEQVKQHTHYNLTHVSMFLDGKVKCPVEWAKTFYPLLVSCVESEDFEAAKGVRDAIIEFLNGFGADIPNDAILNLPDYQKIEVRGIMCLGIEGDPSVMASGGAIWL